LAAARPFAAALLFAAAALSPSSAFAATPSSRLNINIGVVGVAAISNLEAQPGSLSGEINLTWTEPTRAGTTGPYTYDMRVSTLANIATNAQFLAAKPLSAFSGSPLLTPGPGRGQAAIVITGLEGGVVHYFALREIDSLGAAGTWLRSVAQGWNPNNFAAATSGTLAAAITDLTGLAGPGDGQVALAWTAPTPGALVSYRIFHATFSAASVGGTAAWRTAALPDSIVIAAGAAPGGRETTLLTLSSGLKYFFAVETTNTAGTGPLDSAASGAQVVVRAKGIAPITDLVAGPGPFVSGINLTWTEPFVSSVTAPVVYQVRASTVGFINDDADFAAAQNLSAFGAVTIPSYGVGGGTRALNATGLTAGVTYYLAVRAVEGSTPTLAGAWLRVPAVGINLNVSAMPLFGPQPPDPITDLTALPGSAEGEVNLIWTAPKNQNLVTIASYEVRFASFSALSLGANTAAWYAAASSAAFSPAAAPGARETGTIGGLMPATTWYFAIKSIDASGQVSPVDTKAAGAAQASALPRSLPPATPSGLIGTAGLRRARLDWTDLMPAGKGLDFAHYRVERSTDLATFVSLSTTTNVYFLDLPLTAGNTYYYRLVARDLRGNVSAPTASVAVVPFSIAPMEPIGITVAANAIDVTLTWSPTVRFADGTPFLSTDTPSTDELIGYAVDRATDMCAPQFVRISTLSFTKTTLVDPAGGKNYFYRIFSFNSIGISTNVLTISTLGERNFFIGGCETVLSMDDASSKELNAATNGRGADISVHSRLRPEDNGGTTFQSVEWKPMLDGVTELKTFSLPKPARIIVRYETQDGSVVPSSATGSGFLALAGGRPAAASPKDLGMYWYNGGEFKKMYGKVDAVEQTVSVESPNMGVYQIRAMHRSDSAVLDVSNVSNRVITPNGDNLNDQVIFTYDPGPNNATVSGSVYDVTGALVSGMRPGLVPNTLIWDGKVAGRVVASGVYVYKIEGEGKTFTGTVVVAR
jgi:hypothetical protein